MRGCSCRGTAGFAHVSCLAEEAKILLAEAEENNLGSKVMGERFTRWRDCSLCEQKYHGVVKCALGWACWKTYSVRPEADWARILSMTQLGNGLFAAGHYEDALSVQEANLSMLRRIGAPENSMFVAQGNLAISYEKTGRHEESLRLLGDVYSRRLKLNGEEHLETLQAASNYVLGLVELNRLEEGKSLMRKAVPVARRVLGESDDTTLRMRWVYTQTLYKDTGASLDDLREAVTTLEDVERTARRVLGAAHPSTMGIEGSLRDARAALIAREAEAMEAAAQNAFRTARVKLAQERSELAEALADMRVAIEKS